MDGLADCGDEFSERFEAVGITEINFEFGVPGATGAKFTVSSKWLFIKCF
jgi:hypothetical protein